MTSKFLVWNNQGVIIQSCQLPNINSHIVVSNETHIVLRSTFDANMSKMSTYHVINTQSGGIQTFQKETDALCNLDIAQHSLRDEDRITLVCDLSRKAEFTSDVI